VPSEPVLRRSQLTGTWRLDSITEADADGSRSRPPGRRPNGLLTYTADGWMSAVILVAPGGIVGAGTTTFRWTKTSAEKPNVPVTAPR
jgi:hypothetical protein